MPGAGRSFAIWDSEDLMHWKNERLITVKVDKTRAPEAIYNQEDKNYVFY